MTKPLARGILPWLAPIPLFTGAFGWLAASRPELVPHPAWSGVAFVVSLVLIATVLRFKLTRPLAELDTFVETMSADSTLEPAELGRRRDDELNSIAAWASSLARQKTAANDRNKRSERRAQALTHAMSATVLRVDRAGTVLDCHVSEHESFALPGLTTGASFADLLPESIADVCRHALALTFADGASQWFDFKVEIEGESRSFQAGFSAAGADEAFAVVREGSRHKQTHSSKQHLDTILAATLDPILMISRYGEIRDANEAARDVLGIDAENGELSLIDFVPAWARPHICDVAIPTAIQSGAWHGETAFLAADGSEIPVSLTAVPHRTEFGAAELVSLLVRDQSERQRFDAHLLFLEDHDPLTSLYTRKRFVREVEHEMSKGELAAGAVVRIDLDDLKHVNDSFGYDTGDRLLQGVSKLLGGQIRAEDVLARLDGDEFAILLGESRPSRVESVLECILTEVRDFAIDAGQQPIGVTASAGVAFFPDHGETAEELLARADQALDRAKGQGRNQFAVFKLDEQRQKEIDSRLSGDKRIREALADDRFALHLQPILDLDSDTIAFYEVLLRMCDDDGKLVPPSSFLGTAERFGLVRSIDQWVVRQSIQMIGEQRKRGNPIRLSINLSGKSLGDFELTALIEEELARHSVDPSWVTFEITESTASADVERARIFAIALKQIGCRIALDDFGVGFSSLHKLKSLPVDYLKIDGSFIENLSKSKVDQHLVRAVVELARALRKQTVAEYVENAETVALLKSAGVDFAQGFHIGRPEPIESLFPEQVECAPAVAG